MSSLRERIFRSAVPDLSIPIPPEGNSMTDVPDRADSEHWNAVERAEREGEAYDNEVNDALTSDGFLLLVKEIVGYKEDLDSDIANGNPLESIVDDLERLIRDAREGQGGY